VSAVDTAAREKGHAHWTSNLTFILSAMTAAIGLGSIWKFPYLAGSGGGGAFVVVYLLTCAIITVPVLIAELMLGRRGQADPATAMRRVATDVGASPRWSWMGGASILAVFAIGTYYSVVGGWVFAYTVKAATGQFRDRPAAEIVGLHDRFMADPWSLALWHGLFMAATVFVIAFGIRKGIERSSEMFMTALLLILLLLVGYAMVEGDWQRGLSFLLKPDFEALTLRNMLTAVGLSFFTIGTGMAIMMTYGSYLTHRMSVAASAVKVAVSVPVCAMIAGFAIFPLVFANGLDPAGGPGLVLVTLPTAFGQMPGGTFFGTLFFILASFAALTSAIAGMEPSVAWSEERGIPRVVAAIVIGVVSWVLGLGTVLSFNLWADWHPLGFLAPFAGMTVFQIVDFITSNVMLPLINILIALFVGWIMPLSILEQELGGGRPKLMRLWRFLLRVVAPALIAVVLIAGIIGS